MLLSYYSYCPGITSARFSYSGEGKVFSVQFLVFSRQKPEVSFQNEALTFHSLLSFVIPGLVPGISSPLDNSTVEGP